MKIVYDESNDMNKKIDWIKSLKVGDVVCDCRFKHLQIAKIFECRSARGMRLLVYVFYRDWIPTSISFKLSELWEKFCNLIRFTYLVDKDLTLEDGAHCSAMYCCDPGNHTRPHPN